MRYSLALLFLCLACENPTGKNALPNATNPKETTLAFLDALRNNRCELAISFTSGALKESYQKMIEAKGLYSACEAWREPYLPYDKIEYTFDEKVDTTRKKVWFRLEKDTGEFLPASFIVEERNGRWWVISV
jgi:hypothetical protein